MWTRHVMFPSLSLTTPNIQIHIRVSAFVISCWFRWHDANCVSLLSFIRQCPVTIFGTYIAYCVGSEAAHLVLVQTQIFQRNIKSKESSRLRWNSATSLVMRDSLAFWKGQRAPSSWPEFQFSLSGGFSQLCANDGKLFLPLAHRLQISHLTEMGQYLLYAVY